MGLSRNKVAVPEGVAGTPPFWSNLLDASALGSVQGTGLVLSYSLLFYTAGTAVKCLKFFENTEKDNEVKRKQN